MAVFYILESHTSQKRRCMRHPRYHGENHLHYLTTSTYRRTPVFRSERFKRQFIATLAELRTELEFRILG